MSARNLLLLFFLASLWGPSFLFIKVALEEMGPITLAALRIGIAALLLNLYVIPFKKTFVRKRKFWRDVAISGFFAQGLPFILINWGEQHIDSTLAAILNGLTPIFTLVIANFAIQEDKMNFTKTIGTLLGFGGLLLLISPSLEQGFTGSTMGILAVSAAAVSYGIALVYSRIHLKDAPQFSAPASQLLVASLYVIPLAFVLEKPALGSFSTHTWGAILFLASLGTALGFVVYFRLLEKTSASFVSQVTYLMPAIGVVLGIVFLNESLSASAVLGGAIILLGVILVNKSGTINKKLRKRNNPITTPSVKLYSFK